MTQSLTPFSRSDAHALRVAGDAVVDSHEQIASIVSSRLGRGHAELLATPVRKPDGSTLWTTPLAGPVVAAADLDDDQRAAVERRATRMLDDIRGLGAQFTASGGATASVGVLLGQSARTPAGLDSLFSVGGKPVLALWGHAAGPESARPVPMAPPAPPPVAPPVTPIPRVPDPMPTAPVSAADERRRRWPLWFALLSLLMLIALLLMLKRCTPVPEDLGARIAEAENQNKVLEDEIAKRRSQRNQYQCVADPPPVVENKPAPEPEPPKQAEAPAPVPPKQQAKSECPGERPVDKTPQVVVVFDQSSSMSSRMPLNRQQLDSQLRQGGGDPRAIHDALRTALQNRERRMDVAKSAVSGLVQRVPSDVSIGLVTVGGASCQAETIGFFPPAKRRALLGTIDQLEPRGGTPLGDGITKAASMVDGVHRDALMVVVSDGAEGCGQNTCAIAAQIARDKPRLRINVVDIGGAGAGDCIARATGGKVFTANDAESVGEMTKRAGQDSMAPASCKASTPTSGTR